MRPHTRAHRRTQALLSGYLDDALPTHKRTRIERHIRTCHDCRRDVTSLPNTLRMLRSLKVKPPPNLVAGVIHRLRLETTNVTEPAGTHDRPATGTRRDTPAPTAAPSPADPAELHVRARARARARARDLLAYCLTPAYLRKSIPIALVIGIAVTAIYQLGDFISGRADTGAYVMCACNFIVPFVLVSVGLMIARSGPRRQRR